MRRPASNKLTGRPIDQVPMMFTFLSGSIAAHYQEPTAVLQERLQERAILFLSRNDSLYSLLFANFIFIVKFHLDFIAGYVQYVSLLATGHIMQHNIHFLFSFTSSQPACLWGKKTLAEILEWLLQCLHEFMWLL